MNGEHEWIDFHGHIVCRKCTVVQRADGKNKPCKGPAKLRPMEKPFPLQKPWED